MIGTSQGTPYPGNAATHSEHSFRASRLSDGSVDSRNADHNFDQAVRTAKRNVELVAQINSTSNQLGRTWSIPVDPEKQSRTPIWSGRMKWQRQVREVLNSREGIRVCGQHHVDRERVYAVAVSMARSADHRTGRRVTVSRGVLAQRAGISLTVLKRARRALSDLGLAREMVRGRLLRTVEQWAAEAHHGRRQTKATSVWALVSPASRTLRPHAARGSEPSPVRPQEPGRGPQSLSSYVSSNRYVTKYKTTRARASGTRHGGRAAENPRPIALQRAAAELLRHAPSLKGPRHIGAVCDVIRAHSIDTERWSGRDIARALSEDTKRRGWNWPAVGDLRDPVSYLRRRIARLDWTGPSYSELAKAEKARRDAERAQMARDAASRRAAAASESSRRAAMRLIRQALGGSSRR